MSEAEGALYVMGWYNTQIVRLYKDFMIVKFSHHIFLL